MLGSIRLVTYERYHSVSDDLIEGECMLPVEKIMTTEIISVNPETPIYEALDLLVKNKISGVPVVDQDMKVVGILSEKDVLKILLEKNTNPKALVDDYMARNPICFKETDSVIDLCKFFIQNPYRRVPIVRDGKLVGIVSRRNLLTVIIEAKTTLTPFRYN